MAENTLGSYADFRYKPRGRNGASVFIPKEFRGKVKSVKYVTPQGSFDAMRVPGNIDSDRGIKFLFNKNPRELQSGKVKLELQDGTIIDQDIQNPFAPFRHGKSVANDPSAAGDANADMADDEIEYDEMGNPLPPKAKVPSGFESGNIGYGVFPGYMGDQFPEPTFIDYKRTKAAPYSKTNVFDFASQYGDFVNERIKSNAGVASDLALSQLDTELQGLQKYAPAASALKRSEISVDNLFNQAQRQQQVEAALPGASKQLAEQTGRAETYAQGRIPDAIQDRAFELGIRSSAADSAYAGGFGTKSSVARKASDLLSVEQRLNLAQYGEGLLSSSLSNRANLLMAPTSYSNAGEQIQVMPSLSGSQLAQSNLSQINAQSIISAPQAMQAQVQQEQFQTTMRQNNRQFNATNALQTSVANTAIANQFAASRFDYDVGYAGQIAAANQFNITTQERLRQQEIASDIQQEQAGRIEDRNTISDAIQGVLSIGNFINDAFFSKTSPTSTGTPTTAAATPDYAKIQGQIDATLAGKAEALGVAPGDVAYLRSFESTTGTDLSKYIPAEYAPQAVSMLRQGAEGVLRTAGLSYQPTENSVSAGYDATGRPLYADKALRYSNDPAKGNQFIRGVEGVISPFGVLSPEDKQRLNSLGQKASDRQFLNKLTALHRQGDVRGFIAAINAYATPTSGRKNQARAA